MVVEQKRWLTAAEFTDMLGLCQFLPGGNIMNLTIALGARFHGVAGAVTAFAGLMAAPFATVICWASYMTATATCRRSSTHSTAWRRLPRHWCWRTPCGSPRRCARGRPGLRWRLATFVVIAVLRLPLPPVLPAMAAISTLLVWRFRE